MKSWEEIIAEAKSKREQELEDRVSELDDVPSSLKKDKKKKKGSKDKRGKKGTSKYQQYLDKQLEFKKKKYEEQKKRQIEKLKEKSAKEREGAVKKALSSTKYDTISYKDQDPTAYKKAIGNVGSAVGALAKAGVEALKSRRAKKKAEKEASEAASKQPDKKEPGKPGRPKASGEIKKVSVKDVTEKKPTSGLSGTPERIPSTKRLPPASKKIAPSGGAPYQAEPAPQRETGMRLGQRARRNPALKSALIKTRMENYSDWREEFLFEVDEKANKVEKEKIIDIMKGKNKVEMNPMVNEDHKEIASGEKKDDEGYMANVELDQMERAIKALRKKVKRSDTQLPAWVQSKITRAADYVDTASEYLQSDEGLSEEKEEKRYCKLCRREESKGECSYGPSMWEKYTISEMAPAIAALGTIGRVALGAGARQGAKTALVNAAKTAAKEKLKSGVKNSLERAGQRVQSSGSGISPEDSGASAYSKALSNIVGEEVEISEAKKSQMKCNKPKAQAHGSGESGKSHVVKACEGGKEKLIRFGQLGVKGSPKKEGESKEYASRRNRFKTRHAKNIAKGKMSAAYWADKVKW